MEILQESDKRKKENEEFKQEGDVEDEELEVIERDNQKEDELHEAVVGVCGALFATHKELTLPFVNFIYNNILTKAL